MDKLKVLMCSEASFLSSGFGTYAKEILSRLHNTNKYQIAEFASYAVVNDSRDKDIKWRFYANAVKDDDPRHSEYVSRQDNQFGRWRFEKVLLDFKPDVVIDVRDYWMSFYQGLSPLRKYFHWILMPTVDSEPQQEDWIDTFLDADAIFTYSDWGADVLKKQSGNKINYINTASPGVDLSVFNLIQDTKGLKTKFGIEQDTIIIGSVMRNQKRKLIPELLFTFRKLLDRLETENPKLGEKLYLYLHTSYPDAGWDIPELLKETRLSNKVLFTYYCGRCGDVEAHTFSHPVKTCKKCYEPTCRLPSVALGVTNKTLSEIYNMFDIYVQYAICEGFGMPQVEAAACGVPIITVDYSAMCDIIHKLDAYKVKIQTKFKELETKALRVYPNNDDLIHHILSFLNMPDSIRAQKRQTTRLLTEKHYNWDHIAKIWENYLDSLDRSQYRSNWNQEPVILPELNDNDWQQASPKNMIMHLANACLKNLNDQSKISSMFILNMYKDIMYGFSQSGTQYSPFDKNKAIEMIKSIVRNNNQAEYARINNLKFEDDFIEYAHIKERINQ